MENRQTAKPWARLRHSGAEQTVSLQQAYTVALLAARTGLKIAIIS